MIFGTKTALTTEKPVETTIANHDGAMESFISAQSALIDLVGVDPNLVFFENYRYDDVEQLHFIEVSYQEHIKYASERRVIIIDGPSNSIRAIMQVEGTQVQNSE